MFCRFIQSLSFCLAYIWNTGHVLLVTDTTHSHQYPLNNSDAIYSSQKQKTVSLNFRQNSKWLNH